ncbi:hypothetical protein METBIDRAFT_47509 [Metschnikowia bicuspidata var. bicuspidata NRRL YB-4993]|uniref:Mediator of RNA polymerase II transcription subunit 4 n=1 Tax=Metschnikowia bicuspidata var. bicuspidata NRRL YB-4993 TaxID=869754 RepID=A0A1A0H4Y5_9ASCO|nr:hypothetical protein METBIDRAFT_47509 [Metschnikowia bicuspidata var. bicuspidata NRRL YB-4993]OBA19010.1 hypothetical protein METBIDRAFT_47509 [Metschnikowia bicuspidata var. bicuspidata NRRL YB-4993]
MFPHKRDQSFISTPVSRVGSSARLNQLSGQTGSRPSSRPATPGAYVTSSLNPARNVPVTSNNSRLQLAGLENLQIEQVPVVENLRRFEASFNQLSQLITSFKETGLVSEVNNLIEIEREISEGLCALEPHHNLGVEIQALTKVNKELDTHSKGILKELISCRSKLQKLPKLPAAQGNAQKLNDVDVQTVLDYAMKLAKFSKAPATVLSQFIHPNNYIWPAEDALRRGMLAMASIKPEELIQAEIGHQSQPERVPLHYSSDLDVAMEDVDVATEKELSNKKEVPPKPIGASSVDASEQVRKPATATLDLDLFDPEDDDDDSD